MTESTRTTNPDPENQERIIDEQRRIAEIGRIVGSTFDIANVYPKFAELALSLISADRVIIAILSEDRTELIDQYVAGIEIPDDPSGGRRVYRGTDAYTTLFVDNVPAVYNRADLDTYNSDSPEEISR